MLKKEYPIIFSTDMVRAILDGRKTMTRRVIKGVHECPPDFRAFSDCISFPTGRKSRTAVHGDEFRKIALGWCPYGQVGDRLWVRETWRIVGWCPYGQVGDRLWVRETWRIVGKSSSLMLQVQYKSDMTKRWIDVSKEQFEHYTFDTGWDVDSHWRPSIHMPRWASRINLEITKVRVERLQEITEEDVRSEGYDVHIDLGSKWFVNLWDSLNAKRGYSWDTNPWVWVISFKVNKDA